MITENSIQETLDVLENHLRKYKRRKNVKVRRNMLNDLIVPLKEAKKRVKKMQELINEMAITICDSTVGELELEGSSEEYGALVALTYLQKKFLNKILETKETEKDYENWRKVRERSNYNLLRKPRKSR